MLRSTPRHLRLNHPVKILLAFVAFTTYLFLPSHRASITLNQADLARASPDTLERLYEDKRESVLRAKRFEAASAAKHVRAPQTLPNDEQTFDPDLEKYVTRLRHFVKEYLSHAPSEIQAGLEGSLEAILRHHLNPRPNDPLPQKIWSTNPRGLTGVDEYFNLWSKLLPRGLSPKLAAHLPPGVEYTKAWELSVSDDNEVDRLMSRWTGEKISRGLVGKGKFSELWGRLEFGVLRADVFR